jgi:hypothetical protein
MAALKFNERRQGDNESFESFVTDLRNQDFGRRLWL